MSRVSVCLVFLGLAGCFGSQSPSQKLADAAYDLNTATRFGRMDVALEHVAAKAREEFTKSHGTWGRSVRVVDLEFGGINIDKKTSTADIFVTVTWQRPEDSTIRVTSLTQKWTDTRGTWALASEEAKGDTGLLAGEEKPAAEGAAPPPNKSRYQTKVIPGYEE